MLNLKYSKSLSYFNKKDDKEHFYAWLSGFTLGDGYFSINQKLNHSYCILLKKSDKITLKNIKLNLDLLENIWEDDDYQRVILKILLKDLIINKIIPLFKKYPLITNKFYSFEQWSKSLENIYYNNDKTLAKQLYKDKNINVGLKLSDSKIPFNQINNSIILGFIEAEGSFKMHFERNKYFRFEINISQNELSKEFLEEIAKIIHKWEVSPLTPEFIKANIKNKFLLPTILLNNSSERTNLRGYTNKTSMLRITQVDVLYYIIMPTLDYLKWYTSKEIDYIIFNMLLNLVIRGLHHLAEGFKLIDHLLVLSNTNINNIDELPWEEFLNIIEIKPIYDLNLPYYINSKNYILSKKHNRPLKSGVYIYDLNHNFIKLVGGQDKTAKYFNVLKHIIVKHLNTGQVFLNKYILKNN